MGDADLLLLALIALAATLYSAVGHGGASGYLAAMALLGLAPASMKPSALAMNVVVAGLVCYRLWRAGHFDRGLFLPFALGSVPLAIFGGWLTLPGTLYRALVGVALLIAAARLLWQPQDRPARGRPDPLTAAGVGGVLGFVSGATGVGGGIFLSPLLLFFGWANMRTTAAVSAAFILVNSLAGLAGLALAGFSVPAELPWFMLAALAGGLIGSELAVRRAAPATLKRILGVVLVIAGAKMIATT